VNKCGYKNIIADIYESDDSASKNDIENALSKFGQASNLQGYDPHGVVDNEDLVQNCLQAIKEGWIERDEKGELKAHGKNSVEERIDDICGGYKLTKIPKESLVARIVAQTDEFITGKRFWSNTKSVEEFIVGGGHMNFKNVDPKKDKNGNLISRGIIYLVFETSEYRRSLPKATAVAAFNPDSDVRIILYKQYIKAYDAPRNFVDTLNNVKCYWDSQLAESSKVHFNGAPFRKGNCYIYGAVPSLRSLHNLDKMIFLQSNGDWKQK